MCLGPKKFEELQVIKFAWYNNTPDFTAWDSSNVEEVDDLEEFQELLNCDNWQNKCDGLEHEHPFTEDI